MLLASRLRARPAWLALPALVALACSSPAHPRADSAAVDRSDLRRHDDQRAAELGGDHRLAAERGASDLAGDRPYQDLEGLTDDAMKAALYNLVKGQSSLGYKAAREAIYITSHGGIDVHGGMIECVYTGRQVAETGAIDPGGLNTEHSWPQSQGADVEPARSDLHDLFPADSGANSQRSSLPYGDTSCTSTGGCQWQQGGSAVGQSIASSTTVFDVRLLRQGDIARAHFYFAVRYQLSIGAEEEKALRGWNLADPPDDLERGRNAAIEKLQNNRNPFVDRPDFVDRISDY